MVFFFREKTFVWKFSFIPFFQLSYSINIEYATDLEALLPPELSIPARGFVPRVLDTFTVHLPCSGKESEEIPIAINLHIRAPSRRNDTRLNFKRNKICLKGQHYIVGWLLSFRTSCELLLMRSPLSQSIYCSKRKWGSNAKPLEWKNLWTNGCGPT